MDLIWLLIIWAIVGLLGALRKPPRGTRYPQVRGRPEVRQRQKEVGPKKQEATIPEKKRDKKPEPPSQEWDDEPSPRRRYAPPISRKALLNGIVMKEVLSKPRGLRPWQPWGQRQN